MSKFAWDHIHLKAADPEKMALWLEKMFDAERPGKRKRSVKMAYASIGQASRTIGRTPRTIQ